MNDMVPPFVNKDREIGTGYFSYEMLSIAHRWVTAQVIKAGSI
jgi:hypothetical protein